MTKTSRKTKPKAAPRKRTDYPAGCRLSAAERERAIQDVAAVSKASGMPVSLGAYTKHALLSHGRYRRMEVKIREALANEGTDSGLSSEDPGEYANAAERFLHRIRSIMEAL